MNTLRLLSLVLAATALFVLVSGTLGFSSTVAERNVSLNTTTDDAAYVGYQTSDVAVSSGDTIELVEVTNRFAGDSDTNTIEVVDVEISVVGSSGIEIQPRTTPEIGVGEEGIITADVERCLPGETATAQATVELEGGSVEADISGDVQYREFEVECTGVTGVVFRGSGNAEVSPSGLMVDARVIYLEPSSRNNASHDDLRREPVTIDTSKKVTPGVGNPSGQLVAIYFPESDTTFVHPQYDVADGEFPTNWASGPGTPVEGDVFG